MTVNYGRLFTLALGSSILISSPSLADQLMMQGMVPVRTSPAITQYTQDVLSNPCAKSYKKRGEELMKLGMPKEAVDDLNQSLLLEPRDAVTLLMKGEVYFQSGMFPEAINSTEEAIKIDPKFVGARVLQARALLRLQDYQKALDRANELMPLCSNPAEPLMLRGAAYEGMGKSENAINDLSEAIKNDPRMVRAYYYRAKAYQDAGEFQKAIDDYSKVISMQPGSREAYLGRAWSNYKIGNDKAAVDDCSTAIKFNNADVLKAVERYVGEKATDPSISPDPEYYLGFQMEEELKNALVLFDDVLKDKPGDSDALRDRGIVYMHQGKYREAVKDFDAANAGLPRNAEGFSGIGSEAGFNEAKADYQKGNEYLAANKYMDALNSYRAALDKYPQYARCWHNMALACAYLGDFFSAELCSIHAVSYRPDDWKLWHTLGYSVYQEFEHDRGNPKKLNAAVSALHQALLLNPDSESDKSSIRKLLANVKSSERSLAPTSNFIVTTMPVN